MAIKKKPSFEDSMHRLEEIVSTLEKGEISLEESMDLFTEGSKLSMTLTKQLDAAEQKVALMIRNENGAIEETSFNEES